MDVLLNQAVVFAGVFGARIKSDQNYMRILEKERWNILVSQVCIRCYRQIQSVLSATMCLLESLHVLGGLVTWLLCK